MIVSGIVRLVQDPEISQTGSGKTMAKGSLAWTFGWGDNKKPQFIDYIAWEPLALRISKFAKKGMQFFVVGKLIHNTWTNNDGQKRSSINIQLTDMEAIFTKKKEDGGGKQEPSFQAPVSDEDIPF